jgi:hypothetical protein
MRNCVTKKREASQFFIVLTTQYKAIDGVAQEEANSQMFCQMVSQQATARTVPLAPLGSTEVKQLPLELNIF